MSIITREQNIWKNSDTWMLLLAFPLGFCTATFQIFSVDTAGFTLSDLGMMLFSAIAVYRAFSGKRLMVFRMDLTMVLLFVFFSCILCSALPPLLSGHQRYLLQYVKSTSHFSYMWFFAVCCAACPVSLESIRVVFRVFVICAIPINLFGIYQVPARAFDLPLAWIEYHNVSIKSNEQLSLNYEGFFRATSVFSEPSALAQFTIITAILLLVPYLMFNVRLVRSKFLFHLSLHSTFVAMFLTFSLTLVLQLVAFIAALFLVSGKASMKKLVPLLMVMSTVFVLANLGVKLYSDTDVFDLYFRRIATNVFGARVEGTGGDSFADRADAQKMSISVSKKVPILGTGFGCMPYVRAADGLPYQQALEVYIYALATTGVVGGAAITLFMLVVCVRSVILFEQYRRLRRPVDTASILVAIVPFLCVNQAVIGLSSDSLITTYYWVIIGMSLAVYYHPEVQAFSRQFSWSYGWSGLFRAKAAAPELTFTTPNNTP